MARGKPAISKLLTAMRKMIREVNDQEICRRLEILINSEKDDLPAQIGRLLMESPDDVDPTSQVPEPYTQYVKHYLYMVKREDREQEKSKATEGPGAATRKTATRTTVRKKTKARATTKKTGGTRKTGSRKTGKKTTAAK